MKNKTFPSALCYLAQKGANMSIHFRPKAVMKHFSFCLVAVLFSGPVHSHEPFYYYFSDVLSGTTWISGKISDDGMQINWNRKDNLVLTIRVEWEIIVGGDSIAGGIWKVTGNPVKTTNLEQKVPSNAKLRLRASSLS